ncbi:MAG: hypothetical protein H6571_23610 [Lewinellaceae bacterium]|nr:hypothetical protein [Lewinellaceae bacterium]
MHDLEKLTINVFNTIYPPMVAAHLVTQETGFRLRPYTFIISPDQK